MAAHPDWLREGKVRTLMQIGLERNPKLGDVPFVMDLAKTEDDRRVLRPLVGWTIMGRPYLAPPGIPEDRKVALRRAFHATMKDPAFRAEAQRAHLWVDPLTGEQMEDLIRTAYSSPPAVIQRAKAILEQAQRSSN